MILWILILLMFFVLSPVGSLVRTIYFYTRPAEYIYSDKRALSGLHNFLVMVLVPGMGYSIIGVNGFLDQGDFVGHLVLAGSILLVIIFYFVFVIERELLRPPLELAGNLLLGGGIAMNLYLGLSGAMETGPEIIYFLGLGHLPIILLLVLMINRRYRLLVRRSPDIVSERVLHEEVLDYIPEETTARPYPLSKQSLTGLLLVKMPLRLLIFTVLGGALISVPTTVVIVIRSLLI